MPPRRPPRRGKTHGLPGAPALAEVALKDLRRAHALMERGEHANAAVLFERQARDAGDRGLLLPAAHLSLQAGRARLLAGEIEVGRQHLHQGLEILSNREDLQRLEKSGSLLIKDLTSLGQDQLAEQVKEFLGQVFENHSGIEANTDTAHPFIPYKCQKCGAFLRAEDLETGDSQSTVCVYCGSRTG